MYNENKHTCRVVIITTLTVIPLMVSGTLAQGVDQWRVMPIRSQEEFNLGVIGGEGEQNMHGLARSLSNPNVIYSSQDVAGPWKSIDGGNTWRKLIGEGLYANYSYSIEVDPVIPDIVFIIVCSLWDGGARNALEGLYRSMDGGDNWEQVLPIVLDAQDGNYQTERRYQHNITYDFSSIGENGAKIWYAAFLEKGLYRSDNFGDTGSWTKVADLTTHGAIYEIEVNPSDGSVYIGTAQGLFKYTQSAGLQPLGNLQSGVVPSIEINLQDPNMVYATLIDGLYKSVDAGNTFSLFKQKTGSVLHVFINPGHPDTIYLVGDRSWPQSPTIITHDGGQTWIENASEITVYRLPGVPETSYKKWLESGKSGVVVPNPQDENKAVGFYNGIFVKTTDGGSNWLKSTTLFTGYAVWTNSGFAFDKFDPNRFTLFLCDVVMAMTKTAGDWFYRLGTTTAGKDIRSDWRSQGLIPSTGATGSYSGSLQPIAGSETMVATVGDYPVGQEKVRVMYLENESSGWDLASYNKLIKAEHLDENKNYVSDTYNEVETKDNVFSETIPVGHYVRATFDQNFTKYHKVAIWADKMPPTTIEIYANGNLVTTFVSGWSSGYEATLTNLTQEVNVLDLKMVTDDIKLDYIRDSKLYRMWFIAYHLNDPSIVYAGELISHDAGKTFQRIGWAKVGGGDFTDLNPIIMGMCNSNPDVVYAIGGYTDTILRSDDKGETWYLYSKPGWKFNPPIPTFTADPIDCNKVYTVYSDGDLAVFNGSTWTKLGVIDLTQKSVGQIAIDPQYNSIIYVAIGSPGVSNIWRSINAGDTWEDISYNLPRIGSYPMAVSPHTGELLVGGACGTWVLPPPYESSNLIYNKCIPVGPSDSNNIAPIFDTIGDKTVDENQTLTFAVTATDPDGDPITYSAWNLPEGATFIDQTFSWTPSDGQAGTYNVTFVASDGKTQTTQTITITVGGVNQAPKIAPIDDKTVDENSLLSFTIDAVDLDGDSLTFTVEGLPSGAVFADQTFSWTPSFSQAGTYQVTFIASDGQAQDSITINIKVNNINQPPVFNAIYNSLVHANQTLTFTIEAIDPDGDKINYSASDLPTGSTFINQVFSWTPSQDDIGSYQITFIASDGQDQDTETITVTVVDSDIDPPSANGFSPDVGEIQVPINSLVTLHVTDNGTGVDANSVTITLDDDVIYTGNTQQYEGTYGICHRTGTNTDYFFTYQANEIFDFDKVVKITVNAADIASNAMDEYTYLFITEMRSFGKNKKVSSLPTDLSEDIPVTMADSLGNIWVAWHAGIPGSRNIYVSVLAAETEDFAETISLTNNDYDQCNPDMMIGTDDTIYVVWQDNTRGNWDICVATSLDGQNWFDMIRVTDSNDNEVNPAIAVDKGLSNRAYIAWQDGRNGNQDIYMAGSSNGFITETLSKITSNSSDQLEPDIAIDSDDTITIVWTDMRNGSSDIYGAASNSGAWTNVPVVSNTHNQSSPAVAAEPTGSTLHLLWVDDTPGHKDIYYAVADGLPDTPLTGTNIIDDTSAANQLTPAIISTANDLFGVKVFACWQDQRHVIDDNADTDLYFAELSSVSAGTNILVGDEGTNSDQSNPAIGVDGYGHPYIIWADNRNGEEAIYYAGGTFIDPIPLEAEDVIASIGATIGVEPNAINDKDNVSVIVPAQACTTDVTISISRIKNPPELAVQYLSTNDFGPSGIEFNYPVTVTIPYHSESGKSASAYWYNSLTGALSQQGITDIKDTVILPSLHALSFKTTHFTLFCLIPGDDDGGGTIGDDMIEGGGGGGGGGGCSINTTTGYISIAEFALPYVGLSIVMVILRLRDLRKRKTREAH